MWRHWHVNLKLFSKNDIDKINERLETMAAVTDNGWAPKGIGANWGAWTAFEWKSWVLVYSSYCLEGILEKEHMEVWMEYVEACRYLSKPTLSTFEINEGHKLFKKPH